MPFSNLTTGDGRDDSEADEIRKKIIEEKVKRRQTLREQFQKERTDPFRHASQEGGAVFDPAIQRYQALKASSYEFFRPTIPNAIIGITLLVLPMATFGYCLNKSRTDREHTFRTGQVAYKDRIKKLVG